MIGFVSGRSIGKKKKNIAPSTERVRHDKNGEVTLSLCM